MTEDTVSRTYSWEEAIKNGYNHYRGNVRESDHREDENTATRGRDDHGHPVSQRPS